MTKLLTPQEAAQILGVTVQTLADWRCTKRYDLTYVKVGRLVKYPAAAVEAFIAARTVA